MDYGMLGIRIKAHRKALGLTQQELADSIGRAKSTIQQYEKGKIAIPQSVIEKLAAVFQCNISELIAPWDFEDYTDLMWLPDGKFIRFPTGYELLIEDDYDVTIYYPDGYQLVTNMNIINKTINDSINYLQYLLDQLRKDRQK